MLAVKNMYVWKPTTSCMSFVLNIPHRQGDLVSLQPLLEKRYPDALSVRECDTDNKALKSVDIYGLLAQLAKHIVHIDWSKREKRQPSRLSCEAGGNSSLLARKGERNPRQG